MKKQSSITNCLLLLLIAPLLSCGMLYSNWSGLLSGGYAEKTKPSTLATELGYAKNDIIVIVQADNIGIHRDQSDGALDAMRARMVKTDRHKSQAW